jgi:aspartate/methionine/tyrosine aminotransferase
MQSVQTPIIPTVSNLISDTPDTISLGQGVVYYGPPPLALEKLSELNSSLDNHKYGAVDGLPELIDCIAHKLEQENKIEINSGNKILVTAGANMAFMHALFAITDPGDEIILQRPYYFNHEMAINMLNCKAVVVSTDKNYQLNIKKIKSAITDKTRAIVTISPNNPSGVVYPDASLKEINSICQKAEIYHINDEAYEYFTYNNTEHYSPASAPETEKHTISLYSLSKAYGIASWRIGYMVAPEHLYNALMKAQDTNLICPSIASQFVAIGAMQIGRDYCNEKLNTITGVREMILDELKNIDSVCTVPESNGAFYFLIKLETKLKDIDITQNLIKQHKIAVIPGHIFGMTDGCYLRIAYGALDKDTAVTGIRRLTHGIKSILQ